MNKIISILVLLFSIQIVLAQDTLSVRMYKDNYKETFNPKKATFAFYKISNQDQTISTLKYSYVEKVILSSETFKNGEPFGVWYSEWTKKSSEYSFTMKYYNENKDDDVINTEDTINFSNDDKFINAELIGGEEGLKKVLYTVEYPQIAVDNDIEGKVLIRFVVNENGIPEDFTIYKSVDKLLDKAALKSVLKISNYKPATLNGVPVKSSVIIPIVFKLG